MSGCTLRAASGSDLGAALSLVEAERAEVYGLDRIPEILEDAVDGTGEYRALIAARDGECAGVGVYGLVAGTLGTAAVYAVVVGKVPTRDEIGRALLEGILADLTSSATRLVVAEFPGNASLDAYRSLLEAAGFVQESQVDDYFEDGLALVQYRIELN